MKEYIVTSGLFDRKRKLVFAEDYIAWENRDLKGSEFTKLDKVDIVDFKHGMDWIVWYKFTVGRQFSITFKSKGNKQLVIRFNSYFGLHHENNQKYADIVDDIWRLYHSHIVDLFLDDFYNRGEVKIQEVKLTRQGITFKDSVITIPWDKVETKDYYNYFAIYHRDDPQIHLRISYNEFGTETLWSTVRRVLKDQQVSA